MTETRMRGFDPREPEREMRLGDVTTAWRVSERGPDEADVRAVNERIMDAWYDYYRLHSPDGWDEWHEVGDDEGRPTEEHWEDAQGWFYDVVRDIDVYSRDGRDMQPMFARGLVRDSVKDQIPGYRDFEAVVEPAYDERLRAARRLPPVERDAWLREHPVVEFVHDDDDFEVDAVGPESDGAAPSGGFALAGMCLSGRVPERSGVDLERDAVERSMVPGRRVRMADVAYEVEEARESAAVAAAEREADALEALNRAADEDEYGPGRP